jgi:thiol-disulfide isomerase/thioredoxin
MSYSKNLFIGLLAGIALTMTILGVWARHFERSVTTGANPWLLEPFLARGRVQMPKSSQGLPRPMVPAPAGLLLNRWSVRPLGQRPMPLKDFGGKVVFLNIWSTTCGPCIAEMPGIEKLQESLQQEPVAFLAVAGEDEQTVRSFLRKAHFRLPVYVADKKVLEDLHVTAFPTTLILDRGGRTVYTYVGGANWDDDNVRMLIRRLATQ